MTAIFPSASELKAIAGPIVEDSVNQIGSTADIYTIVAQKQKDKSVKRTAQLAVSGVKIRLKMLTSEQAQQIFGKESVVEMKGTLTNEVELEPGDVIEVTAGDFEGRWLEVSRVIEKPLSESYALGLIHSEPFE